MAEQVLNKDRPSEEVLLSREVGSDGGSPDRVVPQGSRAPQTTQSAPSLGSKSAAPLSFLLGRPALLVRAARHYEGAGQILIRQAVLTAQQFVSKEPVELPAPGQWVVADCPARVDFSGEPLVGVGGGWLSLSCDGCPCDSLALTNCHRGLE